MHRTIRSLALILALLSAYLAHPAYAQISYPPSPGTGFQGTLASGQFLAPAGTLSAPAYAFSAQTGMGMYRAGASDLRLTPDGINSAGWSMSGNTIQMILTNVGNSTTGTVASDGNGLMLTSSTGIITPGSDGVISLGVGGARFNNGVFAGTVTGAAIVGTNADDHLDAYDAADNSTSNKIQQWTVTTASTLRDGAFTGSVVGVGAGNYVVKLCTDGATCSGANLKATLTVSCTAAVGTTTAMTINNSSIAAGATLTLQPSTACATTAESGAFTLHLTTN